MIKRNNIFNLLNYTLFVVVVFCMSVQNSISTIDLFIDIDSELVESDWEEETDDEEKNEKETKNEKTEPEFSVLNTSFFAFNIIEDILVQAPFWEFNFDIHTPPPDFV